MDERGSNTLNKIIPFILTLICATVIMIYLYPWIIANWSVNSVTFWLIICGVFFGLLILNFGVFTPLLNYMVGSSSNTNFTVEFVPPFLTLITMVALYVVYLKPKVIDPYGYGW